MFEYEILKNISGCGFIFLCCGWGKRRFYDILNSLYKMHKDDGWGLKMLTVDF